VQYNELGGVQDSEVPGGTGNVAYTKALSVTRIWLPTYTIIPMMNSRIKTS